MRLNEEEYRRFLSTMPIVCVDCVVRRKSDGKFLLIKRKNEPLKGLYWVPGGRLLKNERLDDAVRRKMKEEIGVEVEILKHLGYFEEFFERTEQNADSGVHSLSMVYLVEPVSETIVLDDQSSDWDWFDELPEQLVHYKTLSSGGSL
ncbi:MAG: NUDIX domain-containing protein [Deltaproteobacteria bacterium]|nr:NUDIX domain-containing protein [Deltaproteobacteria bacterium]